VMALRDALIERDELVGESITEVIEAALTKRGSKPDLVIVDDVAAEDEVLADDEVPAEEDAAVD
jgi:hypothetical protein